MQSSAFRIVSVIVTLLLVTALVGLVMLTLRSQPAVTIQPLPTATPTTVPTPTATPFETLGADLVSPEGGYRFQPMLGSDVTFQGAAVTLSRVLTDVVAGATTDASPLLASTIAFDTLPLASLGLRPNQPLAEAVTQIAQPFVNSAAADLSEVETVRIGVNDGVALSWRGVLEGEALAGRIAVTRRDADTLFVAAASAPVDVWASETDAAMQSILPGVTFFEPATSSSASASQPALSATPTTARTPGALPTVAVVPAQTPASTDTETATQAATQVATQAAIQSPDTGLTLLTPTPAISSRLTPTPTPTSRGFQQPWTVVSDAKTSSALRSPAHAVAERY